MFSKYSMQQALQFAATVVHACQHCFNTFNSGLKGFK